MAHRMQKMQNMVDKVNGNVDGKEQVYLAGQDVGRGSKGRVYTGVDIEKGPKKGDMIHGANKYADKDRNVMDYDFTYKPSSRGGWTITGVK